jgi:acetyltransferase-like isoleucine patch superfamily enzyme
MIGDEVLIMDTDWHGVGDQPARTEPVIIQNGVWLASRAVILRGVTLGEGCIVAAGAVVTRSVEPFTVVAGVPAQAIRKLNPAPCAGYRGL